MTELPLGLLGGTFDPVHNAHLRLALDALQKLELESVRWIPLGNPGHRGTPHARPDQRVAMLQRALAGEPRFTLDKAEIDRSEPTYTVDTLQRLRAELGPARPLLMIVGMDSLLSLPTWREWEKLFELAHFAVAKRPGFPFDPARLEGPLAKVYRERLAPVATLRETPGGHIAHFSTAPMDISSTDIRTRIARGQSVSDLIPASLVRYIEAEGLYR